MPNENLKKRLLNEHQLFLWHLKQGKLRSGVATFYQCVPAFIRHDTDMVSAAISDAFIEIIFDRDVYRTLMTYMQCNLNASQAAKALYVHRNSLQYRIDKFIERTGLDIRHFQEASICLFHDESSRSFLNDPIMSTLPKNENKILCTLSIYRHPSFLYTSFISKALSKKDWEATTYG